MSRGGPHNWQCWLVLASLEWGEGGIRRYWLVLASLGGEGRYWAVLGGIGLSGFPDFREWRLWRALGNCAGRSGIGRYWVVLAFFGGPVLGGINLFGVLGGIGRFWAVLGGIGWYWPFFLGWYWAVLGGIGLLGGIGIGR